jgi:hypothetical protein
VTGATLAAALKSSGSYIYGATGQPSTMVAVVCHLGYALATPPPFGYGDEGKILFGNEVGVGWQPLDLGTAIQCTKYMPAAIAQAIGEGCA